MWNNPILCEILQSLCVFPFIPLRISLHSYLVVTYLYIALVKPFAGWHQLWFFSFLVFLGFTLLLLLLFFWALYICLCSSLCSFLVQFRGMSSRMQLFLLLWFLFGSFWCIALVLAVQNSKLFSESYYFEPYLHQNQLAFK